LRIKKIYKHQFVLGLALLEMVPLFLPGIFQYGGFGFRLLLNPDTDPDTGIKTSTKDEGKFRKASGHPKRHIALIQRGT
jgi:hypothetical protein